MNRKIQLLFAITLFTISTVYSQNQIGEITGGAPTITIDQTSLKSAFNAAYYIATGDSANFNTVSIVLNGGTDHYAYLLLFTNSAGLRAAFGVNAIGSILYVEDKTACTSSACSWEPKGCVPKTNGGCTLCSNSGLCTKTVTSGSMLGF
jgi:hypothetical protein